MPSFNDLFKELPSETQAVLKAVWEALPAAERQSLQSVLTSFPSDQNLMKMLLKLSVNHFKLAFGNKHAVVIVGPANVGKSTLYNQLIRSRADQARVSSLPGTTRANQAADAGLFTVVDTPGADAVGEVGEAEKEEALNAAHTADFLIVVFDAIQGVKRTEQELFDELVSLHKPFVVALNKTDLVKREEKQVVERAAANLHLKAEQVIPISAKDGKNLEKVLMAIAIAEPEIVAAMGSAMPAYRWQLAWRAIVSGASISAVIAAVPLPVVDFAPLVVAQSLMVLSIARIYDYKITFQRARELLVTFGMGFLGRTAFQELSKLGGLPGWLLAVAVATSTTVTMGYAAVIWFEKGEKLTLESLQAINRSLTKDLLASLRSLGKKKPGNQTLKEKVEQALSDSPLAEDRAPLDQDALAEDDGHLKD